MTESMKSITKETPRGKQRFPRGGAGCRLTAGGLRHLLLEEGGCALIELLRREIFLARRDPPRVAGGIGHRAAAVAPELVGERLHDLRTGADRPIEQLVAI